MVSVSLMGTSGGGLQKGVGFYMGFLAVVFFLGFIFRAVTGVNVQWACGAVLGG